jgi:hypothetical protein
MRARLVVPAMEDLMPKQAGAEMTMSDDNALRDEIENLLKSGLATEAHPRADTPEQIHEVIKRLHESDGTLKSRLVIGGLTLEGIEHGGFEQACETCMYYLVHRKYCELPELEIPVEAEWSCRLWRI